MSTKIASSWRRDWLRTSIADVAGNGHPLDPDDVKTLPVRHQETAKAIAANARALHRDGRQAEALAYAREHIAELDGQIDEDWSPQRTRPDKTVIDEIRGGF